MKEITVTINDKQLKGREGDTVLQICKANEVYVPTLCHLDGLSDLGACRMCVVEIQGERRPVPACTYPAREGLVVKTNTEQLEKFRRQILELLFTERNHFCMFCEQSGDCELQQLAYKYRMDNVRYQYTFPTLPVDTLSNYLIIEHNRCVLCGRCIRTCSEIAANYTLDFGGRGRATMVVADLDQPIAESSCTSCGACVQACPTGAIFNKLNTYRGTPSEWQRTRTVCPVCGVGCEIDVLVKDNNMVRIEAPQLTGLKGPLCKEGRFELLRRNGERVTSPLIRNKQGKLEECTLEKAAEVVAEKVRQLKGSFAGMASSRLPSETLSLFNKFMRNAVGTDMLDTLDGEVYRVIRDGVKQFQADTNPFEVETTIEQILEANCILVVGADPDRTNPIVGNLVRRAVRQKGAKLIVVDPSRNAFLLWTDMWLKPVAGSEGTLINGLTKIIVDNGLAAPDKVGKNIIKSIIQYRPGEVSRTTGVAETELEKAAEMYAKAERAVIIYGKGLLKQNDPTAVTSLLNLAEITGNRVGNKLLVMSLKPNSNSRGGWELGVAARNVRQNGLKGLYLLLGDEAEDEALVDWLRTVDFLAVQTSYHSPVTSVADVVLPSPIWAEREGGKYVSMDGNTGTSQRALQPPRGVVPDSEILTALSRKLGH